MRLERLRQLTREEIRWRVETVARANVQHACTRLRAPQWRRGDILRVLEAGMRERIRGAVTAQRWHDVHDAIADRLTSRPARFILDPSTLARLRHVVLTRDAGAAGHARERAERIVAGEYDLLGYRSLRFAHGGRRVDWHFDPVYGRRAPGVFYTRVPYLDPVVGDHKIIWELNRHQHWLALGRAAWLTGDSRYANAIVSELDDWLQANPPLVGINWASMLEIGFRAISWTWALHCLLGITVPDPGSPVPDPGSPLAGPWLVDMLVALARQLTHVEQNLSYYFSPNTHLTGEALALYVAGAALPELASAHRWMTTGRRILLDEIERQILPDGGHAERSAHYQRYTLDFYVLALLTARQIDDGEAASQFAGAVGRLSEYTRVMADDDGRLPLIGDDDGGMLWPIAGRPCVDVRDSLATAAVVLNRPALAPWGVPEETVWVAGPSAVQNAAPIAEGADTPIVSRAFTDTGYVVMRDADGNHAVFDAGAHGFQNGGHAHADALAVTLTLGRRPLLIDAGTSTYTMDPVLRDRLRSSASHNTITIDGRSQSAAAGPFHWQSRTDARLDAWRRNDTFDFAEGAHDGYAPLRHRRALARFGNGSWFIVDEISGAGRHSAAAHWHFHPSWTLTDEPGRVRAVHTSGDVAWLLHDGSSAELIPPEHDSALGWYAPVYGTLVPAPAARVIVDGDTPLRMITWVGDDRDWQSPTLAAIPVQCAGTDPGIAVEIADGGRRALFMVRMGITSRDGGAGCRVAGHATDARALHCLANGDRLVRLDLIDVTRLVAGGRGWLSFEADGPFADLHIGVERGVVDLRASTAAATLRLHGISPVHRVRLNGRDFVTDPSGPDSSSLLIHPTDWHTAAADPARLWTDSGAAFARP